MSCRTRRDKMSRCGAHPENLSRVVFLGKVAVSRLQVESNIGKKEQRMDIILTWSGTESREIAAFFREWLPDVLPGIQPWISSEDIAKGKNWFEELMGQLSRTAALLVFVTPANVRSPWIYYEVGSIAVKLGEGTVYPYLIGVEGKHVKDTPLGQFQWTVADKPDTWKLIRSINRSLDSAHNERLLEVNFNSQWPKLKQQIDRVVESLSPVANDVAEVEPSIEEQLTEKARQLLVEASLDPQGRVTDSHNFTGKFLGTNGKNMIAGDQTPRVVAAWKAALKELVQSHLLDPVGNKGELFAVTNKGYEVADLMKSRNP